MSPYDDRSIAETLLRFTGDQPADPDAPYAHEGYLVGKAQAHATLALVDAVRALLPEQVLIDEQPGRPETVECCDAAELLELAQAEIRRLQLAHPCPRCQAAAGAGCVSVAGRHPRQPHLARTHPEGGAR